MGPTESTILFMYNSDRLGIMTKNNAFTFYLKVIILAIPFVLIIAYYLWLDPFMVLRTYHPEEYDNSRICQNEGYVGWQKFVQLRRSHPYDSFILGNSCTKAFTTASWNGYIHGHPYRLFSNNEGLGDIWIKLQALERLPNQQIKNLLIITEYQTFISDGAQPDAMHIMPPVVSGEDYINVQIPFLQAFLRPHYLIPFIKYKIIGHYKNSMKGVINPNVPNRTLLGNDAIISQEDSIRKYGIDFWKSKKWSNFNRKQYHEKLYTPIIYQKQISYLKKIHSFCLRHHCKLRLVISPNCYRKMMNPRDIRTLKSILGENNVYDFSHDRQLMNYTWKYYDAVHYRRCVGALILKKIYRNT